MVSYVQYTFEIVQRLIVIYESVSYQKWSTNSLSTFQMEVIDGKIFIANDRHIVDCIFKLRYTITQFCSFCTLQFLVQRKFWMRLRLSLDSLRTFILPRSIMFN